ncbi:MAG: hypothetical protein ACLRSD_05835 [Oscillibacter sp.]
MELPRPPGWATFEQLAAARGFATMIIISHQERIIQLAGEIVVVGGGGSSFRNSAEDIFPLIMADTLGSLPGAEQVRRCARNMMREIDASLLEKRSPT